MFDTHWPGFCYDHRGSMKAVRPIHHHTRRNFIELQSRISSTTQNIIESSHEEYEALRSLIFGPREDDGVDIEKIICLHLLTAHLPPNSSTNLSATGSTRSQSSKHQGRLRGSWNRMLPCYVVECFGDDSKACATTVARESLQLAVWKRDGTGKSESSDRSPQQRRANLTPNALRKLPIISEHLQAELQAHKRGPTKLQEDRENDSVVANGNGNLDQEPSNSPNIPNEQINRPEILGLPCLEETIRDDDELPLSAAAYSDLNSDLSVDVNRKMKKKFFLLPHSNSIGALESISLYLNKDLSLLLEAISETLQSVNPEKMKYLLKILSNPEKISHVLKKPSTADFLLLLKDYDLIFSRVNFELLEGCIIKQTDIGHEVHSRSNIIAENLILDLPVGFNDLLLGIRKKLYLDPVEQSRESKASSIENTRMTEQTSSKRSESSFLDDPSSGQSSKISTVNKNKKAPGYQSSAIERKLQGMCYTDPDRVILRRMTYAQRVLVGQVCASLKTRKINNEGSLNEKVPLTTLIAPVLSRESIKNLTRGTVYATNYEEIDESQKTKNEPEITTVVHINLTATLISKIRQEIAEIETRRNLKHFMDTSS
ncbi:hypothetical protein QAD02_016812 [Eretmocerus hayati]|uniref:Uncharacterized protein n=1 Tax=Eretmocerus hayati TaxID=131215 RepID=A0ACC2PBM8_9HYME|nr:hypothetical protein QAD02_016812 [Eretmocerus hayati]